jgi:hypothetical protein
MLSRLYWNRWTSPALPRIVAAACPAASSSERWSPASLTVTWREGNRFFECLDVVEPGVVQCHRWRPEPGLDVGKYDVGEYEVSAWAAVARKR